MTFNDDYLPIKTDINYRLEVRNVVKVQGAKANVYHSTFTVMAQIKSKA
jgi:hypothetical protein